jgi:tetratricopeptide (TPR) repeat protein
MNTGGGGRGLAASHAGAGRFSRLDFEEKAHYPAAQPLEDTWHNMDEQGCLRAADDQFQRGLYEAALIHYSRALRFNQELDAAWVGQVRCLICLGEYREAVTWADRAMERFPNSADLLAGKGLALALSGDVVKGMEYSDGAVEMRSPSAWVWLARGECLLVSRQPEANARRCFFKAMELAPRDWHLELRVGMAYNDARLHTQALRPLLAAVRVAEDNPLALLQLGRAQEGAGNLSAAVGYYQRALAVRSDYPEARDALCRVQGAGPLSRLWRRFRRAA